MTTPRTYTDVIGLWPKRSDLATDMTEAGFPTTATQVRLWAHRNVIPRRAWQGVAEAARRRKIKGVTVHALQRMQPIP